MHKSDDLKSLQQPDKDQKLRILSFFVTVRLTPCSLYTFLSSCLRLYLVHHRPNGNLEVFIKFSSIPSPQNISVLKSQSKHIVISWQICERYRYKARLQWFIQLLWWNISRNHKSFRLYPRIRIRCNMDKSCCYQYRFRLSWLLGKRHLFSE